MIRQRRLLPLTEEILEPFKEGFALPAAEVIKTWPYYDPERLEQKGDLWIFSMEFMTEVVPPAQVMYSSVTGYTVDETQENGNVLVHGPYLTQDEAERVATRINSRYEHFSGVE